VEIIATAWCIFTIVVAAKGVSFWWIFALAVGSSAIYFGMRREHSVRFWNAGGSTLVQWVATVYATQIITMGILFLIGFGVGKLF
jgi:hypothetical protein